MTLPEAVIPIVWDGKIAIAVNKPAGLPTQAPSGIDSLESRLRRQLASRTDYVAFPHRLDRPVGGVLLVALGKRAARLLSEQFASRKVEKEYRAEVFGQLKEPTDCWVDWIRKIDGQAKAEVCDDQADDAKRAETRVEKLDYDASADISRLRLFPHTGRMHQLRIQAASRGHAIVGDTLYGPSPLDGPSGKPVVDAEQVDAEQIALQAHSISFHDPRNGLRVTVMATDPAVSP